MCYSLLVQCAFCLLQGLFGHKMMGPKVLHLVGSPTDTFNFEMSLMYSRSLINAKYQSAKDHVNSFAVVHPNGSWSFPSNLEKDLTTIKQKQKQKITTCGAMSVVELLRPDCVVNHILCQKRSHYIGLFEVLGIPVIGVDSQVCANITDKGTSRAVLVQGGVNVPPGQVLVRADIQDDYRRAAVRPCYTEGYPAVVKPTRMENSVGVEVVRSEEELGAALERAFSYGDSVLVDQFIAGREVRCGAVELVPGQVTPLEVLEYCVDPDGIRKFEDKLEEENGQLRQAASTKTWLMDARQEEALRRRVQAVATRVHAVMGCTDFSQIDCRYRSLQLAQSWSILSV